LPGRLIAWLPCGAPFFTVPFKRATVVELLSRRTWVLPHLGAGSRAGHTRDGDRPVGNPSGRLKTVWISRGSRPSVAAASSVTAQNAR
jgi:hypothetical protein